MSTEGVLCDTTNIPKSPAALLKRRVSKTYTRAPCITKKTATIAALATTIQKSAELETIQAKASITPTRQKRKRSNLRALDTENEVKMLQEYFRDVDQCVLEEDVKTHTTPRKEFNTTTRAPWLTPEEKPRGKVRPIGLITSSPLPLPLPKQMEESPVKATLSTPEHKRPQKDETPKKEMLLVTAEPEKEMPLVTAEPEKEVFATPEAKPRAGRKRRAQTSQEHAQGPSPSPVKTQTHAQRTYAGKLRRVR